MTDPSKTLPFAVVINETINLALFGLVRVGDPASLEKYGNVDVISKY
jgi:hypothetical protein